MSYCSRLLHENTGSTPLYEAVLDGKDVCMHSLLEPPSEPLIAMKCPPLCVSDWKIVHKIIKIYMFLHIGCCWLRKAFSRRYLCHFFFVSHMHNDIDTSFGWWRMKFWKEDFPTIPLLMKSYMNLEKVSVIPHIIEEVADFKAFIEPYIQIGAHRLIRHTKAQQFRFYMHDDGVPVMQYKLLCMT